MLGEADRHGERDNEQHAQERSPGIGQCGKRKQAGPELERHHADMLVEIRQAYARNAAVDNPNALRVVRLQNRYGIHRRAREHPLGDKLDRDKKSGAERPDDEGKRGAASLLAIERTNG